ncbi:MAG: PEP-CTERM sorting domain-containing protein [Pseudanabaena sp. CAN_BIN31]|nr:PEP-CTERM sorting domain-containing protein [Pseudanabaena sp. CAN_BIN31]
MASTLAFAASADAIGFSGAYIPANFTLTNINANGSVNTFGAPASIALTGSNSGGGSGSGSTTYTAFAAAAGTVSFDWSYTTTDAATFYDPFGFVKNGVFTQLTIDSFSNKNANGTASFAVIGGDTFGFQSNTGDNGGGAPTTTITNFSVSDATAVPFEFEATGGFLVVGALMLTKKMLKKRAEEKLK